jgi:hypothetical protein
MSELGDDTVEQRLDRMAQEARAYLDSPGGKARMRARLRRLRRAAVVDMSAEAVDARIRRVAALRRLCSSLSDGSRDRR